MRKRLANWDDLPAELQSSVEISQCYALRVTQQLQKLVNGERLCSESRAHSAVRHKFTFHRRKFLPSTLPCSPANKLAGYGYKAHLSGLFRSALADFIKVAQHF
ncbi:MAG: hypothetical protein SLRJCFUN_002486, partial [Candidatus Fervidibacter sp.]